MRQVGSGRGQITAYPRQLESLIRLAEAHARLRFSHTVDVVDVEEATRLHREALKQSAIDPSTGMIDVSILTTGQSEGIRKRRFAVKNTLKDLIAAKGKVNTINYQKTWNDLKEHSDLVRYFGTQWGEITFIVVLGQEISLIFGLFTMGQIILDRPNRVQFVLVGYKLLRLVQKNLIWTYRRSRQNISSFRFRFFFS
jgi:hypothetical protein